MLLGPDNPLRAGLARLVAHPYFENGILLLILASSVALALEKPGLDPQGDLKQALHVLDIVFVCLFALEAAAKIAVQGFALNGPGSYLRSAWNVLDFVIVLIGENGCIRSGVNSIRNFTGR